MTKSLTRRLTLALGALLVLAFVALQISLAGGSRTEIRATAPSSSPQSARVALQDADDSDPKANDSITMTLLHNNDGESKLLPDADGGFPGIARFTQKFQDLGTATDADILLRVTSGDNFLASKEFMAGLDRTTIALYDSIALSGLYETMALGNHDFDFGPDVTARFIEGFSPPIPFLAANIDVSEEPALEALAAEGLIAPSTVFTDPTSGESVGIIGAVTPRLPNISSPRDVVVDPDVAGAINDQVALLAEEGIDRIVLVSHLQGLGEDEALLPQLSGVDIVVAGGGDELLRNDGDTCMSGEDPFGPYPLLLVDADGIEVPVVTAPGGYRCIGQLDVTFDADGNVTEWSGSSIEVPLDGPAEEFAVVAIEEPLREALAVLEDSPVGISEVDLDGRRASVRTRATNVGDLMADALLSVGQTAPEFGGSAAIVGIQNAGGIRNDALIQAGVLSMADTYDIAPFANFAVTVEVPRERFKEMLEVGVSGLPAAEGTFPQIAGFMLEVDASEQAREVATDGDCSLTGAEGSRVRTVTLDDGTVIVENGEVVPGDDIVVATIDFLADGGDCYPLADLDATKVGESYQQALSNFIAVDLGGEIFESEYPVEGTRITIIGLDEASAAPEDDPDQDDPDQDGSDQDGSDQDGSDQDDAMPEADVDAGADADDDASSDAGDTGDADADAQGVDELPNTGLEAWQFMIVAVAVAVAGALIALEAQRAGRLSLGNRLAATRAWFPERETDDTGTNSHDSR